MSHRGRAWLRAAPSVAFGVSLACLTAFVFVPSVMGLYQSRGSPPVTVDSAWLGIVSLIANIVVLVLLIAASRRAAGRRDE